MISNLPKLKYYSIILLILNNTIQAATPIPITIKTAQNLWFFPKRSTPAEVVPLNDARLSAEIRAQVLKIPVRVGQKVSARTLVVKLDCKDTKAKLGIALATLKGIQTRLKLANVQLTRAQKLKRRHVISVDELDRNQAQVATIEAEQAAQNAAITQARLQVNHCNLYAPFKGVVVERLASVGDLAVPGSPLLRLMQIDQVEVSAQINTTEIIDKSKNINLSFVWKQHTYPLRILRILPLFDARTRTQEIRLAFRKKMAPLGASGRLVWYSTIPYVPADVLVRRNKKLGVFVYNNGKAQFYPLPYAREGQPAPATTLNAQLPIILEGRDALQPNVLVTISPK